MFRDLRNIIYDKTLKITIYENKVNINNYEDILIFEEDRVLIKTKYKAIKIKGENLRITRLENKEILVEGTIKSIELGD